MSATPTTWGSATVDASTQPLEQVVGGVAVGSDAHAALVRTDRLARGRADHAVGRAAGEPVAVQPVLQFLQLRARQGAQFARPWRDHARSAGQALRKKADPQRIAGRVVVAQEGAKVRT